MTFDDISIRYHGFQPSDYAQAFFDSLMRQIHDEAPYDSTLVASVIKKSDFYKGLLRINSPIGPFFTSATANNPYALAKKLVKQMHRRLDRWKTKRFMAKEETHDSNVA